MSEVKKEKAKKGKKEKSYLVMVTEIKIKSLLVAAYSEKDAVEKAKKGGGTQVSLAKEFTEVKCVRENIFE